MATIARKGNLAKAVNKFSMEWHRKLGVFFVLPVLIIGFTSIFMAHGKSMGFKKIMVDASWLPGYGTSAMKMKQQEIKSGLTLPNGKTYVGTKTGLFILDQEQLIPVKALRGMDIKNITQNKSDLFVGTKMGAWASFEGGEWQKIYQHDVHSIGVSENGAITLATHDDGLLTSMDNGKNWSEQDQVSELLAALPVSAMGSGKIPLSKLVDDLHTGKAFLGKQLEWVWQDILGLLIIFFTAGGFYFWAWKKQRKAAPRPA